MIIIHMLKLFDLLESMTNIINCKTPSHDASLPSVSLLLHSCTDPILIARALQDYYPGDCRFIPIRQGQLIYVYAMLKDRGNLFWAGSVSKKKTI